MNALTKLVRRITNQVLLDNLFGRVRHLSSAASPVLGMFIKEIDMMTPEKLAAIRRLRQQLDWKHGGN